MPRLFFRKADPGEVLVSGIVVSGLQTALNALLPQKIVADGIFGSATREMVKQYQAFASIPVTGEVDDVTWLRLMHLPEPSIFGRCLQVTAHFEGTGYTHVVGNFDGAGLTWGIIGFTLSNGELGAILTDISAGFPDLFNLAFGSDAAVILAKIKLPRAERVAWADTISRGPHKMGVAEPWRSYFETLGAFPEIQRMQTDRAKRIYWTIARHDAATFGLGEELDLALFYDIAVQNGGMSSKGREAEVRARFAGSPAQTNAALRQIIEDVVVETSKPTFQNDVRHRKATMRTGSGTVHGGTYQLADWGLASGQVPIDSDA